MRGTCKSRERQPHFEFCKCLIVLLFLLLPAMAQASPEKVYHQALQLSAAGHPSEAVASLQAAASLLPVGNIWQQRMADAAILIAMKQQQQTSLPNMSTSSAHMMLAQAYIQARALPVQEYDWVVSVVATLFPGAGHAWMGRWNDALVALLLVWPMMLLSIWAFKRRMGPVTVFFGAVTAWLWSGSIFSATSLAERAVYEGYIIWWQGLWQAVALPGLMP